MKVKKTYVVDTPLSNISISNISVDILIERIVDGVVAALSQQGYISSHTGKKNPLQLNPSIFIDESIVDVGVDMQGIEKSSENDIATQTTKEDNVSEAKERLKSLKRK